MKALTGKVVVVTGASSGFGKAIAQAVAAEGADLAIGARRISSLESLQKELTEKFGVRVWAQKLDVRQPADVECFVDGAIAELGKIDGLVNNAGLALGKEALAEAKDDDWETMFATNVFGVFRMTRKVLSHMLPRQEGHIVNVGSIAGRYPYEGGSGYCGSKAALRSMTQTLRQETCEKGIKVSTVDPGLAETEFSLVRFKGDQKKADAVYKGMTPLYAEDVAEAVLFALTRPAHVNIDDILLTPLAQGSVTKIHRVT